MCVCVLVCVLVSALLPYQDLWKVRQHVELGEVDVRQSVDAAHIAQGRNVLWEEVCMRECMHMYVCSVGANREELICLLANRFRRILQ